MQRFTDFTHHSIVWLKRISDEGNLEMKPPYQRNPVWSPKQKGALIETILLEYPIPEIYMQTTVNEHGVEKHIIVDGQQRIRAVLEFISGEFDISEDGSQWDGMSFDKMNGSDKKKIYEYKFVVRNLPIVPDEQTRAIFQRINRNTVVLNAQELRHATYWGDFIKLMEEIADYEFWSDINIFSANDRRRMIDAEYVSELTVSYLNGIQNKKTKLEDYYQIYERNFDDAVKVKTIFQKVLGEIGQALPNIKQTRWRKKSDFYTLFLALAKHVDRFPLAAGQRADLGGSLARFSEEIDNFLRVEIEHAHPIVAKYAYAVERAASDLGSRRVRDENIQQIIDGIINPPAAGTEQQAEPQDAVAAH